MYLTNLSHKYSFGFPFCRVTKKCEKKLITWLYLVGFTYLAWYSRIHGSVLKYSLGSVEIDVNTMNSIRYLIFTSFLFGLVICEKEFIYTDPFHGVINMLHVNGTGLNESYVSLLIDKLVGKFTCTSSNSTILCSEPLVS